MPNLQSKLPDQCHFISVIQNRPVLFPKKKRKLFWFKFCLWTKKEKDILKSFCFQLCLEGFGFHNFPCELKNLDWYKQCYSQKYVCSSKQTTSNPNWCLRGFLLCTNGLSDLPAACLVTVTTSMYLSKLRNVYLSQSAKYICLKSPAAWLVAPSGHQISAALS